MLEKDNDDRSSVSSDYSDDLRDVVSGFLTSGLNVELVYVILTAIIRSV